MSRHTSWAVQTAPKSTLRYQSPKRGIWAGKNKPTKADLYGWEPGYKHVPPMRDGFGNDLATRQGQEMRARILGNRPSS